MPVHRVFSKNVTAIVMAGGKSSRMGTDKSLLPIGEKTMIEHILAQLRLHFDKIMISSNNPSLGELTKKPVIADAEPGRGPVMGLITLIQKSTTDGNFVQACDIPETKIEILERLLQPSNGYDAVVPRDPEGRVEPLFALYKKSALPAMKHVLQNEGARASAIVNHCKTRFIDLDNSTNLRNINTIKQYRSFIKD